MSFGSDPGRDDSSLPPVNIVIPDDARELERDLIAYRRERRASRRRERIMRFLRPLRGPDAPGSPRGPAALLPLIATCVALSMLAGAMLSIVTISPASAPTVPVAPAASPPSAPPSETVPAPVPRPAPGVSSHGVSPLPRGLFTVDSTPEQIPTLRTAAVALVPPGCGCGQALRGLARAAGAAHVGVYFVGEGKAIPQVPALTQRDGRGVAAAASDTAGVFGAAYRPAGLTVLLVYSDSTARTVRGATAVSRLPVPALRALARPGR